MPVPKESIIHVYNIYAEDLFQWFYKHVMDSCGDGCGMIVCKNYQETANWFTEWWRQEQLPQYPESCRKELEKEEFLHPRHVHRQGMIHFHDGDENFIFTNQTCTPLFYHDYRFIVKDDCIFAHDKNKTKVILGIPDESYPVY